MGIAGVGRGEREEVGVARGFEVARFGVEAFEVVFVVRLELSEKKEGETG